MNQRGHLLLFMLIVLTALTVASAFVAGRHSARIEARPADEVRVQALWLARSALDAGVSGVQQVKTPAGLALVRVDGEGAVQVDLAGARATATTTPPTERFVAEVR